MIFMKTRNEEVITKKELFKMIEHHVEAYKYGIREFPEKALDYFAAWTALRMLQDDIQELCDEKEES